MPSPKRRCKTADCSQLIAANSKSGLCGHCRQTARQATLKRCTDCDAYLDRHIKGNLCGCCISIRAEKKRKACKVCGTDLYHENTTGFCWEHLVQKRAERVDHVKPIFRPYTVAHLVRAASLVTSTTIDEVLRDRFRFFCRIRYAIMHLAKPYFSTIRIGKSLNGRDHSTVVHGQGRAIDLMDNEGFRVLVRSIEREALALATIERERMERIAA